MITTKTYRNLTWLDLENPTAQDLSTLIRDFSIHPAWAAELGKPTERAKTETTSHAFYAALHYPDHPSMRHDSHDIEIDFVVTKDLVITAHHEPIDTLLEFGKKFEVDSTLDRSILENGADLFLAINNQLYRGLREELEMLRKDVRKIEMAIFRGREFKMVQEISHLHRRLIDFEQAMRSHKIILRSFELNSEKLFGTESSEDSVFREYLRVESALENNRELLKELRETNDSLLTAKNNDVVKKLTLMAFVTYPLTLVATVLEYQFAPHIFHSREGFWVIVAILIILFLIMQIYFAYKKWI